jgi:hypothetical protein
VDATLDAKIKAACDSTEPFTRARKKALAAVRWVLRDHLGEYVAIPVTAHGIQMTKDITAACVFDGRDNEKMKVDFYRAVTGLDFAVEVL